MKLISKLFPTAHYKRIFDIPLDVLKKKGVRGLVFDIDNTLSPYNVPEPDEETVAFMKMAAGEGFAVCLLSNNTKKRVSLYNEKLGVKYIANAGKPFTGGLKRAMALLGTDARSTVLIGDQLFTDILCGNLAGARTVLIEPCSDAEQWFTRIKRGSEKFIINIYVKESEKRREAHDSFRRKKARGKNE